MLEHSERAVYDRTKEAVQLVRARRIYEGSVVELHNLIKDPAYLKGSKNETTGEKTKGLQDLDSDVENAAVKVKASDIHDLKYKSLVDNYKRALAARDRFELVPGPGFKDREISNSVDAIIFGKELEDLQAYVSDRQIIRAKELKQPGLEQSDTTIAFELLSKDIREKLSEVRKQFPMQLAA